LRFYQKQKHRFADLVFQNLGSGLPLSLVCSLCAQHLGDKKQALWYAKVELMNSLNPLKQTLAQIALAATEWRLEEYIASE
jgi:hypothetical protein